MRGIPEKGQPVHAIFIDSDDAFTLQKGIARGSGTQDDPFVIENLAIEAPSDEIDAIYIRNTTKFFVIQNVVVKRSRNGIVLENVRNGTVRNCFIQDNQIGIRIESCENVSIENNTIGPNKKNVVVIGKIPSGIKNNRYLYEFDFCLDCPYIQCIDFVWQELSILNQPKRPSNGEAYLPCIPSAFLRALCDVIGDIKDKTGETPLTTLLTQVLKDLRCSLFLFWSGHFRNAMQVLRPALENFLAAIYFDSKNEEGREEFRKWATGEIDIGFQTFLNGVEKYAEWIMRKKTEYNVCPECGIDWRKWPFDAKMEHLRRHLREEKIKIKGLYNKLSEYLHASKYETLEKCITCLEGLRIDQEKMDKWLSGFLTVIKFVLQYLIDIYGELLEEETRNNLMELFGPESLSYCRPEKREFLVKFGEYLRLSGYR
jgi:parallel beta-helix repeat protein